MPGTRIVPKIWVVKLVAKLRQQKASQLLGKIVRPQTRLK